jgi:anti-sigma regulatory factor (Ser/Thr protein kinase)
MTEPIKSVNGGDEGWGYVFTIEPGLEEDQVWSGTVLPPLEGLPANSIDIWQYCVTEMVNNAIDHSEGSWLMVVVRRRPSNTQVLVLDDGIGIFRKIKAAFNLEDEAQAILELSKGKLTTDPERHSGQGVFFTSRVLDKFSIFSHGVYFSHEATRPVDWIVPDDDNRDSSTMVTMALDNNTERTLKDVFDQYSSGDNYDFSKTVVPLRLAKFGDEKLISRSQAKRALARVERFKTVVFDFAGIQMIGQAFADEIFRVWAKAHADVECTVIDASPDLRKMIAAVGPASNVKY